MDERCVPKPQDEGHEAMKLSERTASEFNNVDKRCALKQMDQTVPLSVRRRRRQYYWEISIAKQVRVGLSRQTRR
ncbi:hypothetical protein BCON_0040g00440 [Botryotinia convoluta]|uniref:Uncharacterized protein n=1 Tax=Botryotinia convoluta TaxID=54673 RepID=A0A4Z1IE74_9HELO|nr:hypothetical protein BCON_0040g00440 [Botryotinia convoluta]